MLRLHPDVAFVPRRRYIHRGSGWSKPIHSIWTNNRRPARKATRTADRNMLASLARSANIPSDFTFVSFGLLDICSLENKGHLIQDLLTDRKLDFLCLAETWQQPVGFSHLDDSTAAGFVCISQRCGSGGLTVIHRQNWKVCLKLTAVNSLDQLLPSLLHLSPSKASQGLFK